MPRVFLLVLILLLVPATTASADAGNATGAATTAAAKLDGGSVHACSIQPGAVVRCWGENGSGQLGLGNEQDLGDDEHPAVAAPVDLGPGRTALAISAGGAHSCALLDTHAVRCWGEGGSGQLGTGGSTDVGDDEAPSAGALVDLGGHTAKAISAGDAHTCAILDDDTLRCWGSNVDGELGYGDTTPRLVPSATPVAFPAGRKPVKLTAGGDHTCVVLDDGELRCWGNGAFGITGQGSTTDTLSPSPVYLGPGRSAKAVDIGDNHACAILDDDTLRCWGIGTEGRLGYGNTQTIGDDELPGSPGIGPVALGAGRTAQAVAVGQTATCALLDNATMRCWGSAGSGELGTGSPATIGDDELASAGPLTAPPAGRAFTAVAGLSQTTCWSFDDASVRCTGWSDYGQAATGDTDPEDFLYEVEAAVATLPAIRFTGGGSDATLFVRGGGGPGMAIGGTRIVEIDLTNAGPQSTTETTVAVTVPAGLTLSSSDVPAGTSFAGGTWTVGALAPAARRKLSLTLTGATVGNHPVTAQVASITGPADVDSVPGNGAAAGEDDDASTSVPVVPGADLSLDVAVDPSDVPAFGRRPMTITVTNAGPDAATGISVGFVGGLDTTWSIMGHTKSQGSITTSSWSVGTLASGATATLALDLRANTIKAASPLGAQITMSGQPDKDHADRAETTPVAIVPSADLSLAWPGSGTTMTVGETRSVALALRHDGGGANPDATVGISAPAGLEILGVTGAKTTWAAGVATVTGMSPGTLTLAVTVRATAPGTHALDARVLSSTKPDPDSTPGAGAGEDDAATWSIAVPEPSKPPVTDPPKTDPPVTDPPKTDPPKTDEPTLPPPPEARFLRSIRPLVAGRVVRLRVTSTRAGTASVLVERRVGGRWRRVSDKRHAVRAGVTTLRVGKLRPGRYRVTAGAQGGIVRTVLRVR